MSNKSKNKPTESNETNTPVVKTDEANGKDFVNPLKAGVSYKDFSEALKGKTVREYLADKVKESGEPFEEDEISWLEQELEAHKTN